MAALQELDTANEHRLDKGWTNDETALQEAKTAFQECSSELLSPLTTPLPRATSGDMKATRLPCLGDSRAKTESARSELVTVVQQRADKRTEQRFPGRTDHNTLIYTICLSLSLNLICSL